MTNVSIIEFPFNLGLREPSPGHEPGVKKLPDWLRQHSFHDLIDPVNVYRLDPPPYTMHVDEATGVRNADAIAAYAKQQGGIIQMVLSEESFPLVIGGDCSILIGTMLQLKKTGNYGLFYLDGHTDFMWPELSHTAGAAGMDLAFVTGYGHQKLVDIDNEKPYVKEEHVYCVGNREYEDWYVNLVKDSAINYIDLHSLRKMGIEKAVSGFLQMVVSEKLDGFWIHIDVDVLNDIIMPAVDSRTEDGLLYDEFNTILQLLLSDSRAAGVEITILDPELDPTGEYTIAFVHNFCTSFNKAMKNRI